MKAAMNMYDGIDYDFIYAVFLPEFSEPARWPVSFGMPTAVFTQRYSFNLYTGNAGNGRIVILPKVTNTYAVYTTVDGSHLTPATGAVGNAAAVYDAAYPFTAGTTSIL